MVTDGYLKEILLHGGRDGGFDRSVEVAKRMAEAFGARLHVVYTVEDPLSAGWTAEMSADRLPEIHQAMEMEARDRLSSLISAEDQDRLGVAIILRTGPAVDELVRYAADHAIDLAIVRAAVDGGEGSDAARAFLDHGPCAVLVLR